MILELYTIYDIKGKVYEPPKFCLNEDTAKRLFILLFEQKKSMYNQFPHDYRVLHVGTFNDETCLIKPETPTYKWEASDLIRKEDPDQVMLFQQDEDKSTQKSKRKKT